MPVRLRLRTSALLAALFLHVVLALSLSAPPRENLPPLQKPVAVLIRSIVALPTTPEPAPVPPRRTLSISRPSTPLSISVPLSLPVPVPVPASTQRVAESQGVSLSEGAALSAAQQSSPVETAVVEHVPPPKNAASAPLRLDSSVLRAAAAQSRSAIGRMAEASETYLPTTQSSRSATLQAGVATAAKPACIAANETGSLLSMPYLAFAAFAQLCR